MIPFGRSRLTLALLPAIGAVTAWGFTDAASAGCDTGCPPCRLVNLGPIAGSPPDLFLAPTSGHLSFSINNAGQAVYFRQQTPGTASDVHLLVHLPSDILPSSTQQFGPGEVDIHPWLSPSPGFDNSAGMDINEAGMIVGLCGDALSHEAPVPIEAWLFRLDQTSQTSSTTWQIPNESLHPSAITVDEFVEDTGCFSTAHGISNSSPPAVAGEVTRDICLNPCAGENINPRVGFTHVLSGSYVAREVSSDSRSSIAFSVNDSTPNRVIAGLDVDQNGGSICFHAGNITQCQDYDNPADGLAWFGSSPDPSVLAELGAPSGDQGWTAAKDVHSDNSSVGWSAVPVGQFCVPSATWWDSTGQPTDLSAVYAMPDNDTRAEAIRDIEGTSDLRVVGGDVDTLHALLWMRRSGSWCVDDLNDITANPAGSRVSDSYTIVYAHDVNAHGHVIAHGSVPSSVDPNNRTYAFLVTCFYDLTGDYAVDGGDLGLLLAAWGCAPSGSASFCVEDFDQSGSVDGGDLGTLLANYTISSQVPCSIGSDCTSQSMTTGGAGGMSLDEALLALGFVSSDEFAKWGIAATPEELNNVSTTLAILMESES